MPVNPASQSDRLSAAESITQIGVVRRGRHNFEILVRLRAVLNERLDKARNRAFRIPHRELREEKFKFLILCIVERLLDVGRQIPDSTLEWAERLLSGLVKELLVGVSRLALVFGILPKPLIYLVAQRMRQMIEQHRLKIRCEVNLTGFGLRK